MYGQSYRSVPGQQVPFRWMSPEALSRRRFSQASDVWAFGVTAWEILTNGDMPFAFIADDTIVAERVCGGVRLPRPAGGAILCPEALWGILLSCWEAEPRDRPSFADLAKRLVEIEVAATVGQKVRPSPSNQYCVLLCLSLCAQRPCNTLNHISIPASEVYVMTMGGGHDLRGSSTDQGGGRT